MLNSARSESGEGLAICRLGQPTSALRGRVVVVSGDKKYVERYFIGLAGSIRDFAKEWQLLLVVFGCNLKEVQLLIGRYNLEEQVSIIVAEPVAHEPSIDSLIHARNQNYLRMLCINQYKDFFLIRQFIKVLIRLGFNWPLLLRRKALREKQLVTSYACARFVLPKEIFANCNSVLIIDLDSLITRDFSSWFDKQRKLGAVRSRNLWSRYLAGIVLLPTGADVQKFFTLSREYLYKEAVGGRLAWGVDQLMLDSVLHELGGVELEGAMSFTLEGRQGEAIVSWKGKLKNECI